MPSMQITTTLSERAVDDARLAEILANPGFGVHFSDHMFLVEWTPERGWYDARITPYGHALARPRDRRPALRAGDLRGAQGLPPRRRVDLDLPSRGQRRADDALLAAARAAGARGRRLPPGRRRAGQGRPAVGARQRGGEEPLHPALHVRLRGVPRRAAGPARHVRGHHEPGRRLLRQGRQAGQPVALDRLHARRARRDGRRQDGRQLRQQPGRPAAGDRARAATRWSSSTPRRAATSRSSAA